MTTKKNNKIYTSIAIVIFALALIIPANAQTTSKAADDLVMKLQQKVLLNQKQADQIKKTLNEYLSSPTEVNKVNLESNIESLLEEKQKMKYNIVKKDWWESVTKTINTANRVNE